MRTRPYSASRTARSLARDRTRLSALKGAFAKMRSRCPARSRAPGATPRSMGAPRERQKSASYEFGQPRALCATYLRASVRKSSEKSAKTFIAGSIPAVASVSSKSGDPNSQWQRFAIPLPCDRWVRRGFHWRWLGPRRSPPAKGRSLRDRGPLRVFRVALRSDEVMTAKEGASASAER